MTVLLLATVFETALAYALYCGNHYILCGAFIIVTIISLILSMAYEGKQLNRIKKLEHEIDILKSERRNSHGS